MEAFETLVNDFVAKDSSAPLVIDTRWYDPKGPLPAHQSIECDELLAPFKPNTTYCAMIPSEGKSPEHIVLLAELGTAWIMRVIRSCKPARYGLLIWVPDYGAPDVPQMRGLCQLLPSGASHRWIVQSTSEKGAYLWCEGTTSQFTPVGVLRDAIIELVKKNTTLDLRPVPVHHAEIEAPLVCAEPWRDELEALQNYELRNLLYTEWPFDQAMSVLPYRRSRKPQGVVTVSNTVCHWGQLKLLLSEVEFLAWAMRRFGPDVLKIHKVVYAGAADGHHQPMLMACFPDLRIDLWDPAPFSDTVRSYANRYPDRMRFFNSLFTDDVARKYATKPVLFISDIRRVPKANNHKNVAEEAMQAATSQLKEDDHKWQRTWVDLMRPAATMLKFAPTYGDNEFHYLDGVVRTQAFPPRSTTETRLIFVVPRAPEPLAKRTYNGKFFEDVGAYHKIVTRQAKLSWREFLTYEVTDSAGTRRVECNIVYDPSQHWELYNGFARYDDWRAMQILITYHLTMALKADALTSQAIFDAFNVPVSDVLVQHAAEESLILLRKFGDYLGNTQVQKLLQKSRD